MQCAVDSDLSEQHDCGAEEENHGEEQGEHQGGQQAGEPQAWMVR